MGVGGAGAGRSNAKAVRVLVVRVGAMGDVLHALPAVTALRRARPEWEIGWVVDRRWAALLRAEEEMAGAPRAAGDVDAAGASVVDAVYVVATREWSATVGTLRRVGALRAELRSVGYDVCVDMQGTLRSAVIGRMAAAKQFAGYGDPREAAAAWMYGRRLERRGVHVVEQGCALLGEAVGVALAPARVELPVDGAAELWCDAALEGLGRFCFLAPTAGWGAKMWPAERYGALARELAGAGYGVVVNAVGAEDGVAAAVVRASGGAARTVASTVAQMVAMVRRSGLVVAGDTGPLHLGAALERPVVGLFGPTDPARNGPFGTRARVLRHAGSLTSYRRLGATDAGLLEISVGEVVRAAMEAVGGGF